MEPLDGDTAGDCSPSTTAPANQEIPLPPPSRNTRLLSRESLLQLANRQISYRACIVIFLFLASIAVLTPFKEYYLGNYITDPFDEVRDEVVAKKLNQLGVVTSGIHYFDTFDRKLLPLIDLNTKSALSRTAATTLSLTDFLVRANLRRADLLANLPDELLTQPVNSMVDVRAPLCGPAETSSWLTEPQLLFGNWFPAIRHEFCRDFHANFPHDRFFNHDDKAPIDANLSHIGNVTLGLIAVVNMSEVYLRHFNDELVIRKIMKNVQEGYMGLELPAYTDAVASSIVERYSKGISLADVIALLPSSFDAEHVALVDVLGISALLSYYLDTQQLTMGVNVNNEAAILAEVTHATASYFTPDFLVNTVGMHYVSTTHLAVFWECAIRHTTMDKTITVADVDGAAIKQCGSDLAGILPLFVVNLLFLFQSDERDYSTLDNTTTYTLGRRRESDTDYVPLTLPETFAGSTLLSTDGSAWSTANTDAASKATTPYGYLYTADCKSVVTQALLQTGRNVQKYQAYMGDGLGNCAFRDSQETDLQTLCRLFMTADEVLFQDLSGNAISIPTCASLISAGANETVQALEQASLRQIEWFMIDTTMLTRRIRIKDNTSRQIRTFLLILNLIGASHYALEYIFILKSVWIFVSNSVLQPAAELRSRLGSADAFKYDTTPVVRLGILELLQCDPADGALEHPVTMVLMYLGAVGALSNIFSLGCSAELSTSGDGIVIYCTPSIPVNSLNLVFTTLSSSYWVIRVTLQTRSLAMRLDHVVRDNFARFWLTNAAAVLVIHFTCKGGADLLFQNVELHSDPHIYAILGGLAVAFTISAGFLLVHIAATDSSRLRRMIRQRSTRSLWRASRARATSDRAFVAKWSTAGLDSVLHHCASPQIARQLQVSSLPEQTNWKQGSRSGEPIKDGRPNPIRIHEFVAVHCAGGAHAHLQSVKWYLEPNGRGGVTTVEPMSMKARIFCLDESVPNRTADKKG